MSGSATGFVLVFASTIVGKGRQFHTNFSVALTLGLRCYIFAVYSVIYNKMGRISKHKEKKRALIAQYRKQITSRKKQSAFSSPGNASPRPPPPPSASSSPSNVSPPPSSPPPSSAADDGFHSNYFYNASQQRSLIPKKNFKKPQKGRERNKLRESERQGDRESTC